jgi:hypothetical protein
MAPGCTFIIFQLLQQYPGGRNKELGKLHVNPTHGCTLNLGYEAVILHLGGIGFGVGVCFHFVSPLISMSYIFPSFLALGFHVKTHIV